MVNFVTKRTMSPNFNWEDGITPLKSLWTKNVWTLHISICYDIPIMSKRDPKASVTNEMLDEAVDVLTEGIEEWIPNIGGGCV